MAKYYVTSGKPYNVTLDKSAKTELTAYKLDNGEALKEFMDALKTGGQILDKFTISNVEYVLVKKDVMLPFSLHGGSNKNLKSK